MILLELLNATYTLYKLQETQTNKPDAHIMEIWATNVLHGKQTNIDGITIILSFLKRNNSQL